MVAELRRVCWLRHGGREGGHGARGEAVTIVRTAEHVEAAHTRMVHLKVGKKNDLLIARDGSCGRPTRSTWPTGGGGKLNQRDHGQLAVGAIISRSICCWEG